MNFKSVSLSMLLVLLVSSLIVGGCTLKAAPDPEGLPTVESEDEMMQHYAEGNTQALTPTAVSEEPIPVGEEEGEPTEEVMAEATATTVPDVPPAETVALPTATPTPEPTPEEIGGGITPTAAPQVTQPAPTGPRTHVVQAGENLFRIALRYGTSVEALTQANGITNPSFIYVGQRLKIPGTSEPSPSPAPGGGKVHVVQPGENLFRIALKYNYSYWYLAQYNGISNPNFLSVGQEIRIP